MGHGGRGTEVVALPSVSAQMVSGKKNKYNAQTMMF
jgi:hypothetical protein